MALWKGQENGETWWFVFEGIPEFYFRVVFSNHSFLVFLKHHLKRTVSFHNSCVVWKLRPVVNLDAWKKQQTFSQTVVFHGEEPYGRKQRVTPKTNPNNCSENPWPPKLAWRVHLLTWNVKTWRQIPHRRENDFFFASRLKAAMFAMPARNFWINISLWTQRRSNRIRFSTLVGVITPLKTNSWIPKEKTLKEKERHRHKTIFHQPSIDFQGRTVSFRKGTNFYGTSPQKIIPDISGCLGHVQHCCAEDGGILEDVLHLLNRHGFGNGLITGI